MQDILDQQFQKAAIYKSLFESAGWKEFEGRLQEVAMSEQAKVDKLTRKIITEDKREELNQHIATLLGMQWLLIIKQEMLDEVEPDTSPTQEGEHNTSETY